MAKHTHYDKADYSALVRSAIPKSLLQLRGARFDSTENAAVFFARELDHVKKESYDVEYPELTAINQLPISNEADPGAETITYYTYDRIGVAKIVDNYSTDLPRVDVDGTASYAKIKSVAAAYGYSAQDMRASRLAGKSLDARRGEAARKSVDTKINTIAFAGDSDTGLRGILSPEQGIPFYAIGAGATSTKTKWTEKTADEILDDINGMAKAVSKLTKNVERPDTLWVPADVYMHISTKRIPDTQISVMKYLLDNSPYITNIVSAAELDADSTDTNPYAGTYSETRDGVSISGSGSGVAFLFKNDPRKITLENPMPYYQYPAQAENLEVKIPVEARTAGVIVYYPLACLIAVGVS